MDNNEQISLKLYIETLRGEIEARKPQDGDEGLFSEEAFTNYVCEILVDEAELVSSDFSLCYHKSKGVKLNAWHLNEQENQISLVITHYSNIDNGGETGRLASSEIEKIFKRGRKFFDDSIRGGLRADEASISNQVSALIRNTYKTLDAVNIILITDCFTGSKPGKTEKDGRIEFNYSIWDIERIDRQLNSGLAAEPITIDFEELSDQKVVLVQAQNSNKGYGTYLGFLSGELLSNMYDKYGLKLLRKNVRAFLQVKNYKKNVNKGIRETILESPERFLAYNNGLTVIAEKINMGSLDNGTICLISAEDFQIVNGGQTCASIWHTKEKNKIDISNIQVAMKLNVIENEKIADEMVPKISKYSNTQNPIHDADFSANDPYQIALEKMSQITYIPDPSGGSGATKWFYERARGSYLETRRRQRTPAKERDWMKQFPTKQKVDKRYFAQAQLVTIGFPDASAWGPATAFNRFVVYMAHKNLDDETKIVVDQNYFKEAIAKYILWKQLQIVAGQSNSQNKHHLAGYVIAYYLHNKEDHFIDYPEIWKNQKVSKELIPIFDELIVKIRKFVSENKSDSNVADTTYMKKPDCWEKLKTYDLKLSKYVKNHFKGMQDQNIEDKIEEEKVETEKIKQDYLQNADLWKDLYDWGTSQLTLESINRLRAHDLYMHILLGTPQKNQTTRMKEAAKLIITEARDNGFDFSGYDGIA